MSYNSTSKIIPYTVVNTDKYGVILPHSSRVLSEADIDSKIQKTKRRIDQLSNTQFHRNTHGGKRHRAKQISLREQIDDSSERFSLLISAKKVIAKLHLDYLNGIRQEMELIDCFKTNVARPNGNFIRYDDLIFDESINHLDFLISDICRFGVNSMRIGSHWVYLLLCEGALEHFIQSLNAPEHHETKECVKVLRLGVTRFLQEYESQLHIIIEKTIPNSADWFQRLYANYRYMVRTGESPDDECYGPVTFGTIDFGTLQLFLPSRFAK